jgi:hypothetical protein
MATPSWKTVRVFIGLSPLIPLTFARIGSPGATKSAVPDTNPASATNSARGLLEVGSAVSSSPQEAAVKIKPASKRNLKKIENFIKMEFGYFD